MTVALHVVEEPDPVVNYTRNDFLGDLAIVRNYATAMREVNIRKAEIERAQTISVARSLHRMRVDPDRQWFEEAGGGKDNDWAFCNWAAGEMEQGFHPSYVQKLLAVGYVLPALEKFSLERISPATAGQVIQLAGLRNLKALPGGGVKAGRDVMVDIWTEAVEESGGRQPSQDKVEEKVRAWKKARKAVLTGDLDGSGSVRTHLRLLGGELKKLYAEDPAAVRAAIASWGMAFR